LLATVWVGMQIVQSVIKLTCTQSDNAIRFNVILISRRRWIADGDFWPEEEKEIRQIQKRNHTRSALPRNCRA